MESPCTTEEGQRRRRIILSFALHKQAVKDARLHPEGRTAIIVDGEPLNINVTSTPTKRVPVQSKRKCKHLTPELKSAIVSSVLGGSSYRAVAKIFGVSMGEVSSLVKRSKEELVSRTLSGGRGEGCVKVTPDIVQSMTNIVTDHPQYSLREMRSELMEKEKASLSISSASSILKNTKITGKRLYKEPPERNSKESVSMRIEWAYTFNELRDLGCHFLFVDESGFNISLSRGKHQLSRCLQKDQM